MNHYIEVVSCDVSYNLAPEGRPADLDPLLNNKHKNTREDGDIRLFTTLVPKVSLFNGSTTMATIVEL